jgi:hypothetical protein
MPVRDDEVIDLLQSGVFDGVHDSTGIARRSCAGIAGIDEQRLKGRRYKQGGVAAFNIDDVDVESARGARLGGCKNNQEKPGNENG